jgi:ABC-type transport system substrate-binding protein
MAERAKRKSTRRLEFVVASLFVLFAVLILPAGSFLARGGFQGQPDLPPPEVGEVFEVGAPYSVTSSARFGLGTGRDEVALRPESEVDLPSETLEWFVPLEDGSVWIIDRPVETQPNGRVRLFASDGSIEQVFMIPAGGALFEPGLEGDLWVGFARGETDSEMVRRYSAAGELLGEYPLPPGILARSLSGAPTGELWAQVEEAEVDPDTFESRYRSRLLPVALGPDLEPAPDPVAGAIDGNFIGADGKLYGLEQGFVAPGEEAIEPTSSVVITDMGGESTQIDIPPGYRPYAADVDGRVYAEPFAGTREERDVYRHSIGEAALGAARPIVVDASGVVSRLDVFRLPGLSAFQPSAWVGPDGAITVMTRESSSLAMLTMESQDSSDSPSASAEPFDFELRLIAGTEPYSGDPYRVADVAQRDLMRLVYSGLVRHDASQTVLPDLATAVPRPGAGVSEDGLTITYRIRDDVSWHDGESVTPEDVVATWEYLHAAPIAPRGRPFPGFDQIASVAAVDDQVVVRLTEPFGAAPESLFPFVLPGHLLTGDVQRDASLIQAAPIGSGPYEVSRWEEGERWLLEAHGGSSRDDAVIERIEVRFASEEDALASLQSSPVPAIWLWPESRQLSAVRRDAVGRFFRNPTGRWIGLLLNEDKAGLETAGERSAFVQAYPLEVLESEVLPVEPDDVAPSIFTRDASASGGTSPRSEPTPSPEVVEYTSGIRFGWPEPSYEQLEIVEDAWSAAGLSVDRSPGIIDFYDPWYEAGHLTRDRHEVAAGVFPAEPDPGWGGVFDPADIPSADNPWGRAVGSVGDGEVASLFARARAEYDPGVRARIGEEIQRRLLEDAHFMFERPEYRDTVLLGEVGGYSPAPFPAGDFWNVERWSLEGR